MDEREQIVQRLLRAGVPKAHIAQRLGINRETVARIAVRVGFPARSRGGTDSRDWAEVRAFYEQGHSAAECQRRFQVPPSSWVAAINRGDIKPRPRGHDQQPPGERRRAVAALLDEGRSISEIAEQLEISKPTVCYHARKLGIPPRSEFARRFDWEEISRVYDSGVPMRECKRRFGFSNDAWAAAVKRGDVAPRDRMIPIDQLLVLGRPTSRGHLKARLVAEGLKENTCERCGISEWQGEPLSVHLHHRNGDGLDNRLENLEFLCPNCHSQTDTYGGRNGHRKPRLKLVKGDRVA